MPKDAPTRTATPAARTAEGRHEDAPAPMQARRRSLLLGASALAGTALLPALSACGGSDDDATPAMPPADAVPVGVAFRSVARAAPLDSRFAGLSYEKHKLAQPLFTGGNAPLIALFRLLGPSVLRIGANAVERSSWNGAVRGLTPIRPAHIDELAAFLRATQWQVIYEVNLARNTPQNAAREAAYVSQRLGSSLLAWGIGNEPDLYRRQGYRRQSWNYQDFREEWREMRDAMRRVSPAVPFTGPATAFDLTRFAVPFARDEGDDLVLLTHHYYRADRNDPNSTLRLLLAPDPNLVREVRALVEAAEAANIEGGARLAEANSFFGGGLPRVSNAFGSALWVIDFMFTCAVNGCRGVNMHSGGRGPYTPISELNGTVIEARPVFHGMLLFSQGAQGTPMESILQPAPAINLTAWGVQRPDGGFNAVLVNKDPDRSADMRLSIAPVAATTRFEPLWLRGTSLDDPAGQTLGEVGIGSDGSWSPRPQQPLTAIEGVLTVLVPPASAVLLRSV